MRGRDRTGNTAGLESSSASFGHLSHQSWVASASILLRTRGKSHKCAWGAPGASVVVLRAAGEGGAALEPELGLQHCCPQQQMEARVMD